MSAGTGPVRRRARAVAGWRTPGADREPKSARAPRTRPNDNVDTAVETLPSGPVESGGAKRRFRARVWVPLLVALLVAGGYAAFDIIPGGDPLGWTAFGVGAAAGLVVANIATGGAVRLSSFVSDVSGMAPP